MHPLTVETDIGPDHERKSVVDTSDGSIFGIGIIGEASADEGLEVHIEVALIERVDLVFRIVHTLPADFPAEKKIVLRIHPGEQTLAHVGLYGSRTPDVGHVVAVLTEAC